MVNGTGNGGGNGSGGNGINNVEAFVFYYHPDHLGSSAYISDANGEVTQHLEYFAFGETFLRRALSNTERTPYLFNGKELDEETGLYYYGARYYDPKTSSMAKC